MINTLRTAGESINEYRARLYAAVNLVVQEEVTKDMAPSTSTGVIFRPEKVTQSLGTRTLFSSERTLFSLDQTWDYY